MRGYRWFLLILFWMPAAFGQGIYKWVDAQGQVHYGEEAPAGIQADPVTVKSEPQPAGESSDEDRRENTQRLLRTFEEERNEKEAQAAKEAEEKAKRKRNCVIAQDRLRSFRQAGYIYNLDQKGERRAYNDAERAAALKRAEADVANYCK